MSIKEEHTKIDRWCNSALSGDTISFSITLSFLCG